MTILVTISVPPVTVSVSDVVEALLVPVSPTTLVNTGLLLVTVIVSVTESVVMVMPEPAAKVSVSVVESAATVV